MKHENGPFFDAAVFEAATGFTVGDEASVLISRITSEGPIDTTKLSDEDYERLTTAVDALNEQTEEELRVAAVYIDDSKVALTGIFKHRIEGSLTDTELVVPSLGQELFTTNEDDIELDNVPESVDHEEIFEFVLNRLSVGAVRLSTILSEFPAATEQDVYDALNEVNATFDSSGGRWRVKSKNIKYRGEEIDRAYKVIDKPDKTADEKKETVKEVLSLTNVNAREHRVLLKNLNTQGDMSVGAALNMIQRLNPEITKDEANDLVAQLITNGSVIKYKDHRKRHGLFKLRLNVQLTD